MWPFCYFFVFGQVFAFIQGFAPKSITAAPDIEAYLGFVMNMFIAFGAAFEVPVVVVVLARMGIVPVEKLREWRGYFIVLAFVIAAVITPPGHRLAARAGHPDVPALRGGAVRGDLLRQAHQGAGRSQRRRRSVLFGSPLTLHGRRPLAYGQLRSSWPCRPAARRRRPGCAA